MGFKPAKCPKCNGELQVPENIDKLICMYCGDEISAKEAIQSFGLDKNYIENYFKLAEDARISSNFEVAYNYYYKVLEVEPENYKALYGKAISAGFQSTLLNVRSLEMIRGIQTAISHAPDNEKEMLKVNAAVLFQDLATSLYIASLENFSRHIDHYSLHDFVDRSFASIELCEMAALFDPINSKQYLEQIISICNYLNQDHQFNSDITGFVKIRLVEPDHEKVLKKEAETLELIRKIDPTYQMSSNQNTTSQGGCFIATAVYGDYNAPEVLILRTFRDSVLAKTLIGRIFIKLYYFISPSIVNWLSDKKILKNFIRKHLDTIVIYLNK